MLAEPGGKARPEVQGRDAAGYDAREQGRDAPADCVEPGATDDEHAC